MREKKRPRRSAAAPKSSGIFKARESSRRRNSSREQTRKSERTVSGNTRKSFGERAYCAGFNSGQ